MRCIGALLLVLRDRMIVLVRTGTLPNETSLHHGRTIAGFSECHLNFSERRIIGELEWIIEKVYRLH